MLVSRVVAGKQTKMKKEVYTSLISKIHKVNRENKVKVHDN